MKMMKWHELTPDQKISAAQSFVHQHIQPVVSQAAAAAGGVKEQLEFVRTVANVFSSEVETLALSVQTRVEADEKSEAESVVLFDASAAKN